MSLRAALDPADALCAAGRYFDAHEKLEAFWMKASGDEKILLQGLVQIAAGLHRLKLDPDKTDGAFYLLERGAKKLTKTRALLVPRTLAALESALNKIRASGKAPASFVFGLKEANRWRRAAGS
ncbi:MAG: DUF309 domain-containing protein [Elusimicrobia bacterium]|nr:DUF309 domain-containing protein [Elusimicrobiota bacterium]